MNSKENPDARFGCGAVGGAVATPGGSALLAALARYTDMADLSRKDIALLAGFEVLRFMAAVMTLHNYGPVIAVPLYLGLGAAANGWVLWQFEGE